ncbi:unnamed protein product [Alternaria alternata]
MSPISRMARLLLILHAFVNIVFGIYPFVNPGEYAAITGVEGPDKTLQSTGLGGIAVGWYQLIFTLQGNRRMMASTIPMRLGFAAVMYSWEKQPRKIDREWKEVNEMVIRICEVRMGGKSYFIVDLCYLFANNLKLEMKTILE